MTHESTKNLICSTPPASSKCSWWMESSMAGKGSPGAGSEFVLVIICCSDLTQSKAVLKSPVQPVPAVDVPSAEPLALVLEQQ